MKEKKELIVFMEQVQVLNKKLDDITQLLRENNHLLKCIRGNTN